MLSVRYIAGYWCMSVYKKMKSNFYILYSQQELCTMKHLWKIMLREGQYFIRSYWDFDDEVLTTCKLKKDFFKLFFFSNQVVCRMMLTL